MAQPTRLLLEGPDIEPLLARVRDEHGPSARIVAADKVRVGGFGGFFTKERFEVAVELDPASAGPVQTPGVAAEAVPAGTATGAAAVDGLMALVDEADRMQDRVALSSLSVAVGTAAAATGGSPGSVTDASFAAAAAAEPPPATVPVQLPMPVPVAAQGAPSEEAPVSTQGAAFADVLSRLTHDVAPAPFLPAVGVMAGGAATTYGPTNTAASAHYGQAAESAPAAGVTPAPTGPAYPAVVPAPVEGNAPGAVDVERVLAGLGVPDALLAASGDDPNRTAHEALACVISTLPQPPRPPSGAGDVIVVVGEGTAAYTAATDVARSLRLDPKAVLLAAPSTLGTGVNPKRMVTSAKEASRRAFRLHTAETTVVVAVDAPMGATGARWARDVTAALRPDAVWAVADATRKTSDTERHLARIGRIDALVVHQAAATSDPATVLGLGVPVALLDGRRATRPVWTAVLTARLTGEEDDA